MASYRIPPMIQLVRHADAALPGEIFQSRKQLCACHNAIHILFRCWLCSFTNCPLPASAYDVVKLKQRNLQPSAWLRYSNCRLSQSINAKVHTCLGRTLFQMLTVTVHLWTLLNPFTNIWCRIMPSVLSSVRVNVCNITAWRRIRRKPIAQNKEFAFQGRALIARLNSEYQKKPLTTWHDSWPRRKHVVMLYFK